MMITLVMKLKHDYKDDNDDSDENEKEKNHHGSGFECKSL